MILSDLLEKNGLCHSAFLIFVWWKLVFLMAKEKEPASYQNDSEV